MHPRVYLFFWFLSYVTSLHMDTTVEKTSQKLVSEKQSQRAGRIVKSDQFHFALAVETQPSTYPMYIDVPNDTEIAAITELGQGTTKERWTRTDRDLFTFTYVADNTLTCKDINTFSELEFAGSTSKLQTSSRAVRQGNNNYYSLERYGMMCSKSEAFYGLVSVGWQTPIWTVDDFELPSYKTTKNGTLYNTGPRRPNQFSGGSTCGWTNQGEQEWVGEFATIDDLQKTVHFDDTLNFFEYRYKYECKCAWDKYDSAAQNYASDTDPTSLDNASMNQERLGLIGKDGKCEWGLIKVSWSKPLQFDNLVSEEVHPSYN